VTGFYKIRVY